MEEVCVEPSTSRLYHTSQRLTSHLYAIKKPPQQRGRWLITGDVYESTANLMFRLVFLAQSESIIISLFTNCVTPKKNIYGTDTHKVARLGNNAA